MNELKLMTAKNPVEEASVTSLLTSCGIPNFSRSPELGFVSDVIFGAGLVGADIFVPEDRLEEARAILAAPPIFEEADL